MFKKAVITLILVSLLIPAFPATIIAAEPTITVRSYTNADQQWYDMHTAESEFTISTVGELAYFMHLGTGDSPVTFQNKTVKLGADIIWNDGIASETGFAPTAQQGSVIYKWTPYAKDVADSSWLQFRGVFDGQGHTVSGLYIAENNIKYSGFFGRVRGATIRNVSFVNSYHCLSGNSSPSFAGMAVGAVPSNGCTFLNVSVDAFQNHTSTGFNTYFGGICGGHSAENVASVSFTNCTVSGQLRGIRAVGGIFGGSCVDDTVSMTDCICYANISATSDIGGLTGRQAGGGTYTRCAFFGTLSGLNTSVLTTLRYNNLGVDQTPPAGNASCKILTFEDCFYMTETGADQDYPAAPASTAVGYKIVVRYTGVATPSEAYYRSGTISEIATAIKQQFDNTYAGASFAFPESGTDVLKVEGFQRKEESGAVLIRFISSVKWGDLNPSNVQYIGFQTALLNDYALGTTGAVQTQTATLYTSTLPAFGQGSISPATFGANALATMIVGIPSVGIQNMMVRATYRSTLGNDFYSAWVIFSFINGQYAGSVTVSNVATDSYPEPEIAVGLVRVVVDPDTTSCNLATLLPSSVTIDEIYYENWTPFSGGTTVSLSYGTNHFHVIYSDATDTYQARVSVHRRNEYRVVFNSNGGSYIPARSVSDGTIIPYNASVTPSRPGFTFLGWFKTDGTRVYLGSTPIHEDMLLIAHWQQGTTFSASQTTPFTYTTSSAALNIVWKDYEDAFGERPERVLCTLTKTANNTAYLVEVRENSASFVGSAPSGATISTGAGGWTVKISGLTGTYTFVQNGLQSAAYSSFQSGTTVTNTISGYQPTLDETAALYTANGRFYDLAGNTVVLKGVVTVNVGTQHFAGNTGKASLARLKAEGVNCIRMTMQLRGSGNLGYVYQTDGTTPQTATRKNELMNLLRTAIDNATGMGMYCIVDWGVLGEDPRDEQAAAISFFTNLATAYRDNPYVLYEICNEPNINYPDKWNTTVKPYAEAVITAIRGVGARNVVIVAPNRYARNISEYTASNQKSDDPIDYPIATHLSYNVAYTLHIYAYDKLYNSGNPTSSFGWRMREAIEAGLTIVMTEFSPATSNINAQSSGITAASIPEANKYLNVALENDVNVFLFRYVSNFASGETSSQHMFVKGIVNDLNNGTWTQSQLTECGAWFYTRVLRSNGFIPVANFGS